MDGDIFHLKCASLSHSPTRQELKNTLLVLSQSSPFHDCAKSENGSFYNIFFNALLFLICPLGVALS